MVVKREKKKKKRFIKNSMGGGGMDSTKYYLKVQASLLQWIKYERILVKMLRAIARARR